MYYDQYKRHGLPVLSDKEVESLWANVDGIAVSFLSDPAHTCLIGPVESTYVRMDYNGMSQALAYHWREILRDWANYDRSIRETENEIREIKAELDTAIRKKQPRKTSKLNERYYYAHNHLRDLQEQRKRFYGLKLKHANNLLQALQLPVLS